MNLQELIDQLIDLQPESARSATVNVCTKTTDATIVEVRYSDGEVKIVVDDLPNTYDEGFADGLKKGREEAEVEKE